MLDLSGYKRFKVNVFLESISNGKRTRQEKIYGLRFVDEKYAGKKVECTASECDEAAVYDEALCGLKYRVRIPTHNSYKEGILFKNELPRKGVEWWLFLR